jgi:hypothetical protein
VIELLESGVGLRRGQERGVEGRDRVPPATHSELNNQQAHAEACNNTETGRESRQCAMHENYSLLSAQCENLVVDGSDFCVEHIGVTLCKASGTTHHFEGNNNGGDICMLTTMPMHQVDTNYLWGGPPRTKRAQFCGDRCRNLWRDTKPRRERQVEVAKIENGGRSERYALISNYYNSGQKVILDKQTNRVVDR